MSTYLGIQGEYRALALLQTQQSEPVRSVIVLPTISSFGYQYYIEVMVGVHATFVPTCWYTPGGLGTRKILCNGLKRGHST